MNEFLRALVKGLRQDRIGDLAAMLTYYAIFAAFPMAIFVITMALLVIPPATIMETASLATRTMPDLVAALVLDEVARMQAAAHSGLAVGSALLAIWGASRGSVAISRALNDVRGIRETRPWWRVQITGILVTLAVAVLLVAAMGLLVVGGLFGNLLGDGPWLVTAWTLVRWAGAALLMMTIWALLYRFLPDGRRAMRLFTPGAVVGVLLWVAISMAFAVYVRNVANFDRTYGALGGVLLFVLWLWLSNIAMLFGAEINDVLEERRSWATRKNRSSVSLSAG